MANYPSARKRMRQQPKRRMRNKHVRTTVRTYVKRVRKAIAEGDAEEARKWLHEATRRIDKASQKGVIHWKKGNRYISRLSHQVSQLG